MYKTFHFICLLQGHKSFPILSTEPVPDMLNAFALLICSLGRTQEQTVSVLIPHMKKQRLVEFKQHAQSHKLADLNSEPKVTLLTQD